MSTTVTLLCSGVALGVYIPAMLLNYQLRQSGISTDVVVLESLMLSEKKIRVLENKKAFHNSFRVALTGQKMAKDLWPNLDPDIIDELFERWIKENRREFIVFSGFWMSVLQEYKRRSSFSHLNVEIIHMDADISASWKHFHEDSQWCNHIWLFSWEEKNLQYELSVTEQPPIPYQERLNRYVIHGGGWGMGTYQSKISELEAVGILLDIIAYDPSETVEPKGENRYFMIDPEWSPWFKGRHNQHEFPPFGQIVLDQEPVFKNRLEYHELYDLIGQSKGIISKPGGATLLDSLSSATPIIMLEPFGDYEQKNAELWESLGFGIYYDQWRDSNFSDSILEGLHRNLLNTQGTNLSYVKEYVQRFKGQKARNIS